MPSIRRSIFALFIVLLVSISKLVFGQFNDITNQLDDLGITMTNPVASYGAGVSFYDFNSDGWDDLTMGAGADDPVFLMNNAGVLELVDFGITNPGGGLIQALLWVDYNNNGHPDIFISKDNGTLELWKNDGAFNFSNIAAAAGLNTGIYKHSNATFGDYNHDGCLDLYVSKYYHHSASSDPEFAGTLYKNNCDGTFADVTQSSGIYIGPHHALQPVFTDVNNDGWEDLFIAVDRVSYSNELLINNQDGTFTRVTETAGINQHIDAMSATIGDFDHDQDLDIYVTNNPIEPGNLFYKNNGDETFTNIATPMALVVMNACWGANWIDYNNDTWEDLFISRQSSQTPSAGNLFFVNNQGVSFTEYQTEAGINETPSNTYVVSMGDLNNDGYYDMANGNRAPYTHRLFENVGGTNNYISITLEGTIANRDAIGTWIHCFAGGEHFVRFTHCGENLSSQNSKKNIFGLGNLTAVDSLVLEWNSGTREVYTQPEINTHHYYIEGASFTEPFAIDIGGDSFLCNGEQVVLHAGDYEQYLWNTGDTTESIVATEAGVFSVEVWNEFGLSVTSFPVEVSVASPAEIIIDKTNVSCAGANDGSLEVTLSNGPIAEITWNTGDTTTTLEGLGPGVYSFFGTDDFGCPFESSVSIDELSPLLGLGIVTDALCFGDPSGTAGLSIIGGSPPYSINWWGENPAELYAGSYVVSVSDMNGCNIDVSYTIEQPDSLVLEITVEPASNGNANGSAALTVSGGSPPYFVSWITGDTAVLNINNLLSGSYSVNVKDSNNCEVISNFFIDTNTGLIPESVQSEIRIVPNPNRGIFILTQFSGTIQHMNVYSSYGVLVFEDQKIQNGSTIDLSTLGAGIYYLQLVFDTHSEVLRTVITD